MNLVEYVKHLERAAYENFAPMTKEQFDRTVARIKRTGAWGVSYNG